VLDIGVCRLITQRPILPDIKQLHLTAFQAHGAKDVIASPRAVSRSTTRATRVSTSYLHADRVMSVSPYCGGSQATMQVSIAADEPYSSKVSGTVAWRK
jgi:hypothetical protein